MRTLARHRRPGRGMLFLIFVAVAIFWTGISIGIYAGRRHAATTTRPSAPPAPGADATAAATSPSAGEQLQPGDRVELRMTDVTGPGVSGSQVMTVDPKGMVTLPILGALRAQYLTPAQLERAIAQSYKDRNLQPPGPIRIVRLPGANSPATGPAGP